MLRHTGLRPHPLLCSYKNLGNPQVPSSSLHISLPQEIVFLQATFHGTNREYSYPNKEYIDLIFVSLIVFLIDKYHKTISPESEVYNTRGGWVVGWVGFVVRVGGGGVGGKKWGGWVLQWCVGSGLVGDVVGRWCVGVGGCGEVSGGGDGDWWVDVGWGCGGSIRWGGGCEVAGWGSVGGTIGLIFSPTYAYKHFCLPNG